MRKSFLLAIAVGWAAVFLPTSLHAAQGVSSPKETPSAGAAQQPPAQQPSAVPSPAPSVPAPPRPIIVLDPAHGGTDTGARGENGLAEKDVVLQIARTLQAQFQNQGYRVIMTRSNDSNPSYNDRDAVANAYRDAIFITLHIGSTGKVGTVRAYYDQFWSPIPASSSAPNANSSPIASPPPNTPISWEDAQRPYVNASRRLANLLQLQFAQTFAGSPLASSAVPLRELRSVAEPAVAIEISNVSTSSADALLALSGPLSIAIERAVQAFHQLVGSGAP